MNIFVLSTDPAIAASYHCDQHIHKMILESAQMLSTVCYQQGIRSPAIYKPAHPNHPCTKWLAESPANQLWVVSLCHELENIRLSLGHNEHRSMECIKACFDLLALEEVNTAPDSFIFAGPGHISIQKTRFPTITDQYQQYYRHKVRQWALDKGELMRYKGRPIPEFIRDTIEQYRKAGAQ